MRHHLILSVLSVLLGISFANGQGLSTAIKKIIDRASYEFSNELMYKDQAKWLGATISFQGTFVLRPDALNSTQPYQQLVGRNAAGEPVDVIVLFDEPLRAGQGYGESNSSLSLGDHVRVFGVVQKCREVISKTGFVKVLPVFDLLVAFRQTDEALTNPVFVSKGLRQ
jgi:hypothetical protein